jgi:GNAT superfamily N-acetyltransferase
MPANPSIQIGTLKENELEEASRIVRIAFGTFLGLPNPADFGEDRDFFTPRWHAANVKAIAARDNGRLIGSNIVTRWGSFGFFGPLTILPEYWDRGIAQQLLEATMKIFDKWGVRHTGLFTFSHSPKHVALYQKFGYWPGYLTAIMTRTPDAAPSTPAKRTGTPTLLSSLPTSQREQAITACTKLTHRINKGLDLADEIRAVLKHRLGDVVLVHTRSTLDAFAICMNGAGSEGGEKLCYIKFAAARPGAGANERFDRLLAGCEAFAATRGGTIEAGVNLAREDAYRLLRSRGYRIAMQGVSMQRPHINGFNRADAYVIDDWR